MTTNQPTDHHTTGDNDMTNNPYTTTNRTRAAELVPGDRIIVPEPKSIRVVESVEVLDEDGVDVVDVYLIPDGNLRRVWHVLPDQPVDVLPELAPRPTINDVLDAAMRNLVRPAVHGRLTTMIHETFPCAGITMTTTHEPLERDDAMRHTFMGRVGVVDEFGDGAVTFVLQAAIHEPYANGYGVWYTSLDDNGKPVTWSETPYDNAVDIVTAIVDDLIEAVRA